MDEVIARFQQGDEDAIRELYRRHGGAVRTVAASIVGNDPELVSEVVQQTFLKAWRAAAGFDASREITPWLYSIARRSAIDVLRREGRAPTPASDTADEVATLGVTFERTWEVFEVRRAIDDLPAGEREVVRLSRFVGLTQAEIADELGVPLGTVKSRADRAYRRLAAALRHLLSDTGSEAVTRSTSAANRPARPDVQVDEER